MQCKIIFLLLFVYWVECRLISDFRGIRRPRLSLAAPMPSYYYRDIDGHPGTYAFGYDVMDSATGNTQFRNEQRYPNGTVAGSYGHIDAHGRPVHFEYIADSKGYRVKQIKARDPYLTTQDTWSRPASDYIITNSLDEQPEVLIINRQPRHAAPSQFTGYKMQDDMLEEKSKNKNIFF